MEIKGLKEAAEATKGITPYTGVIIQISYDFNANEVLTSEHRDNNSWTVYKDPNIGAIHYTNKAMSKESIKAKVIESIAMRNEVIDDGYLEP